MLISVTGRPVPSASDKGEWLLCQRETGFTGSSGMLAFVSYIPGLPFEAEEAEFPWDLNPPECE